MRFDFDHMIASFDNEAVKMGSTKSCRANLFLMT